MVSPGSRGTWLSILLEFGWIWRIRLQRCYLYLSNNGDLEQKTTLSTCRLRHDDVAKAGWSTSKGMLKQHEEMWDEDGRRVFFLKKENKPPWKFGCTDELAPRMGFLFLIFMFWVITRYLHDAKQGPRISLWVSVPCLRDSVKAIAPLEERVPTAFKVDPNKVTDVFFRFWWCPYSFEPTRSVWICVTFTWKVSRSSGFWLYRGSHLEGVGPSNGKRSPWRSWHHWVLEFIFWPWEHHRHVRHCLQLLVII